MPDVHESPEVVTEILYSFKTGGSERIGATLAVHLAERGIPTTVCSTHGTPGPTSRALRSAGIPCEALQDGPGGRVGRAVRLYGHLRRRGTTVMHVQHFNMLSIAYRPARLAGVRRIVVTEHTDRFLRTDAGARRIARRYGRKADAVTVVHDAMAEHLVEELGFDERLVRVIPNGVDTARFDPRSAEHVRSTLGIDEGEIVVGCVGRLHPDKDPMNLLRAMERVRSDMKQRLRLLLVGDGELRVEAEAFIASHGLEPFVVLAGEREDVPELMRAMNVFVLPSRTEGLPLVLLEAMATGLPIVATDVGDVAATVEGCGLVVPSGDSASLARAIMDLCRDSDLRARLGRQARLRAETRYDVSVTMRRYRETLLPAQPRLEFPPGDDRAS